jgi:uncharacterized membrane protein (UPF0127 family)
MVANVSIGLITAIARNLSRGFAPLLLALVLVLPGNFRASAQALDKLEITTSTGTHVFSVEVVRNDADREKGLMYRRFLPADRGMLFDFKQEEPVTFWMKNTYIPLDMIFISKAGIVVGMAANAEPLSESLIPSGAPCYGVLEVNAGVAARISLKAGDKVRHAIFQP